jgi:hypothetical protein
MNTQDPSNIEIIAPYVVKISNTIDSDLWIDKIEKISQSSYPFKNYQPSGGRPHLTMKLPHLFDKDDCLDSIKLRSMFLEKALPAISFYMDLYQLSHMAPRQNCITVSKLEANKPMLEHRDNEDFESKHFICMMYINDNFLGGELNLIDVGFKYKPKSGDIMFYRANMKHEVMPCSELRYTMGFGLTDKHEMI